MPYDTLIELGKEVAGSEKQLVFVHSVGRSGSTLMSKAFQEIDTVLSLSEPDIYTQVVGLRDTMPDERLKALLKASTQLLFKPSFARDSQYWVLKLRSFCIEIADLLSETFPTSKSLFLYRNLDNYITSGARAFRIFDPGSTEWMSGEDPNRPKYIPLLLGDPERKYNSYNPIEFITLMWLSVMDKYLQLRRQGINMEAVKYEDLVRNPEGTMRLLLNNLGFSNTDVQKALLAFTKDSQAGSVLSRENLQDIIIPSTSMDEAQHLLDRHDEIRDGTYTLPGTIES